jgi:hypothetical protein
MIDSILTFCDEVLSNPIWFYVITLLIKIVICFAITILFIPICVYIERSGWPRPCSHYRRRCAGLRQRG